jgi:hypothetical protein
MKNFLNCNFLSQTLLTLKNLTKYDIQQKCKFQCKCRQSTIRKKYCKIPVFDKLHLTQQQQFPRQFQKSQWHIRNHFWENLEQEKRKLIDFRWIRFFFCIFCSMNFSQSKSFSFMLVMLLRWLKIHYIFIWTVKWIEKMMRKVKWSECKCITFVRFKLGLLVLLLCFLIGLFFEIKHK